VIVPLLAAAALAGGPAALLDAPDASGLAISGDQVVVTRAAHGGRVRVDAVALDGGGVRHLLRTRRLGPRWTARAVATASSQRVAVIAGFEKFVDHGPNIVRWRVYTGPASGPLRVVSSGGGGRSWQKKWLPVDIAADGDRVLVEEVRLVPDGSRLRLIAGGAPPRPLRWARNRVVGSRLAFAGENVAFVDRHRLIVSDLQHGTRRLAMKVDFEPDFDLAPDGTVVADAAGGLATAAPGRPRTRVPRSDGLFEPLFAGSRITAIQSSPDTLLRPVVLDPAPRPVGVQTLDIPAIDADANGVAWIANGCVLYAPIGAATPSEPPDGPCPRVEVDVTSYDQTLRRRRLRAFVTCIAAPASGCNGTLSLHQRGVVARARFHADPGKDAIVPVTLTRRAARFLRRRVRSHGKAALGFTARVQDARPLRRQLFLVARVR
jgi:hypothetical protein